MTKLKIVHGAPASGKSTYVKQNAIDNALVFDFDLIMAAISNKAMYENNDNLISFVDDMRFDFPKIAEDNNVDEVWIISLYLTDKLKEMKSEHDCEVIKIITPKDECIKRIQDDDERIDKDYWIDLIDDYFNKTRNVIPES